jgi:hypothetical protein
MRELQRLRDASALYSTSIMAPARAASIRMGCAAAAAEQTTTGGGGLAATGGGLGGGGEEGGGDAIKEADAFTDGEMRGTLQLRVK